MEWSDNAKLILSVCVPVEMRGIFAHLAEIDARFARSDTVYDVHIGGVIQNSLQKTLGHKIGEINELANSKKNSLANKC